MLYPPPSTGEIDSQPESEQAKSGRMEQIEKFAAIVKGKRKDAIEARRQSGIEKIWAEDEEHYEGVDEYSRNESTITKSRTMDGPLTEKKRVSVGRSTAFANITRPYCDAAAARVADMLLPTDDRNWALRHTPDPQLIDAKENLSPVIGQDGRPAMRAQSPDEAVGSVPQAPGVMSRIAGAVGGMFKPPQSQPQQPQPMQPVTVADMAQQTIDKASQSAERAQTKIDDWLVECSYHAEVRKVIECSARIGVGILKGPHPSKKKSRAASKTPEGWKLSMEIKVSPASVFVMPWNFYPDGNCGEDIQRGAYCLERDDITARGLRELKGGGYLDDMIDLCLTEGPTRAVDGGNRAANKDRLLDTDLFEIWYFHGQVSKKEMDAAGCKCSAEMAPCIVTMVNDHIIKITMSPLDSGEFPYDVMVWQQKIGSWVGVGVSRQIRTCQKGLNGGVRALQDNSAISSGPQIVVDTSLIEPADGKWHITPNKLWRKILGAEDMPDVSKAFTVFNIETRQVEILNIINYWTKAAEDVTGLPMLLQGQQGSAPETLGATHIVNNNSSAVLRRIARTFDDKVTEPHIGRYYEWLLLHGPEDAKGEFQIDARGSSALVERDLQNQAMMQMLGLSINPAYGLDPEKTMQEVLKSMRLDRKSFEIDEEKKKALSSNQQPPLPLAIAQLNAESSQKIAQGHDRASLQKAQMETGHKSALVQAQTTRDGNDAHYKTEMLNLELQLSQLKFAHENGLSLEEAKTKLATVTMELQTQKELAYNTGKTPQVAHDAVEPAGQAPDGQAFQK